METALCLVQSPRPKPLFAHALESLILLLLCSLQGFFFYDSTYLGQQHFASSNSPECKFLATLSMLTGLLNPQDTRRIVYENVHF